MKGLLPYFFLKYSLSLCRHIPQAEIAQSGQNDDNRSQRRILIKKRSTSSACAVVNFNKHIIPSLFAFNLAITY